MGAGSVFADKAHIISAGDVFALFYGELGRAVFNDIAVGAGQHGTRRFAFIIFVIYLRNFSGGAGNNLCTEISFDAYALILSAVRRGKLCIAGHGPNESGGADICI